MKKHTNSLAWKIGQRVCLIGSPTHWGTIVKVVDKNTLHKVLKFKGQRRWSIHVLWDSRKDPKVTPARLLFREGEGNGYIVAKECSK